MPELGLNVKRAAAGRLLLLVETPGVGKLTAQADGTIVTKVGKRTHKRKVVLAKVSGATNAEGTTTLVLRVAAKYVKDLASVGKLKSQIIVDFKPPPPGEALSAEASATFVAANRSGAAKAKNKGKKSRTR